MSDRHDPKKSSEDTHDRSEERVSTDAAPESTSGPEAGSESGAEAESADHEHDPSVDVREVAELEDSLGQSAEDDSEGQEEPAVSREVQLQSQVERLQAEADANRDKWMRAMAELENFRKRARRELDSSINLARADVLKQLLEVLDNFERALDAFDQAENGPDETFIKGVTLIQDQLLKVLRENGVSRIEAVGEPFDPNVHEAVSQIESDDVPSQHVAHVVKAGYRIEDQVLRPAVVVVAQ
ncbi:MAG TPA: nucleotide exchange factor GrpE [Candidatus Krumholzibacteria bacterium]|nr:nucleotide exchange factor GrpE [Candidatus Krumholzibacteria bacterium]